MNFCNPIAKLAPIEAVLFDIDGTMCYSDPFHHQAFSEMLLKIGYNNGIPITREFGQKNMAGKSNDQIAAVLFPSWDKASIAKFFEEKEALFAKLATEGLKEIKGLHKFCRWIADRGLKSAAVTNAPKANADLMISILGLSDFFQAVVSGEECERSKPFPDPYEKALRELNASPEHSLVFEDSTTGIKAGVAAGMPVIGIAPEGREDAVVEAGAVMFIRDYEDPKLWAALQGIGGQIEEGLHGTM